MFRGDPVQALAKRPADRDNPFAAREKANVLFEALVAKSQIKLQGTILRIGALGFCLSNIYASNSLRYIPVGRASAPS
jgi:hypothetical protein